MTEKRKWILIANGQNNLMGQAQADYFYDLIKQYEEKQRTELIAEFRKIVEGEIKAINSCLKTCEKQNAKRWIFEFNKGYRDAFIVLEKKLSELEGKK